MLKITEKLRIIKEFSGMTQEKLAQRLQVSFATLNSWVNGRSLPHPEKQRRIDELWRALTGEQDTLQTELEIKKKIIVKKSQKEKDIVKKIIANPDIYEQLILSLTYNTNRIEGSTLTEPETAAVLFQKTSLSNRSLIEQMEAKNHQAAFDYLLKEIIKRNFKIDEDLILKLHAILMNGIRDDAGEYRRHPVRIVGSNVPTANYLKVPTLMKELVKEIRRSLKDTIKHTAYIHARFEQIHPFADGNGRTGRLLVQAMLLPKNLPPAVILNKKKRLYYRFLNKAQLEEDYFLFENFLTDAIIAGLKIIERT